jgi:transposase
MKARYEAKLVLAQRANKARHIAAIHAKLANTRKDFLHNETTKIADAFGLICVGNVSGRWLQATNGKSAADASTGMSRNMLRYKAMARKARFVDVSEYLTTETCSECGALGGPKGSAGLEIRAWRCGDCGSVHDRDVNAARVILRLGCQALAEGSSAPSA